jgi:hypothetical protein
VFAFREVHGLHDLNLIFCSNSFSYFDSPQTKHVSQSIISPSERIISEISKIEVCFLADWVLFLFDGSTECNLGFLDILNSMQDIKDKYYENQ